MTTTETLLKRIDRLIVLIFLLEGLTLGVLITRLIYG